MYVIYDNEGRLVRDIDGFQVLGNEIQGIRGNNRFIYYKSMGFNVAEVEDINNLEGLLYLNGELIQDPNYIEPPSIELSALTEDNINNLSEEDATMLWGMLSERLLNK